MRLALIILFIATASNQCLGSTVTEQCYTDLVRAVQQAKSAQKAADANPADVAAKGNAASALNLLKLKLTFSGNAVCLVDISGPKIANASVLQFKLKQLNAAFQQQGTSSGSGNTTNVVSKSLAARIASVAAEYGAVTESVSGSTVTLQGELGSALSLFAKNGVTYSDSRLINGLNRFSYAVAFDTSGDQQATTGTPTTTSTASALPVNFTGNPHTINSITGKISIIQGAAAPRDKLSKALSVLDNKADLRTAAVALDNAGTALAAIEQGGSDPLGPWRAATTAALLAAAPTDVAGVWVNSARQMLIDLRTALNANVAGSGDALDQALLSYRAADATYSEAVRAFLETNRAKPLLSFEYDNNRVKNTPSNSIFRMIGDWSPSESWTLTGNFAVSTYDSTPSSVIPGASRLRDVQVAAQANYAFSKLNFMNSSSASLAYYFQDQTSPAILNITPGQPVSGVTFVGLPAMATQVYAEKGMIHLMQGKVNLIPGFLNIAVPLSFTYSNRSELVTHSVWRGQLGISYDLSSLFGK